ncbi:AraC family transcriptional regulator [Marinilactibacillus kalidii]|uniref:AraC family transcriptional regulator n=1 Tax=Marinilactibacillus kalidii TaxID=2820274 RepID=UPI001ABE3DD4|nr:AraC family transcriptional regulator [Marinilactibacillus kalidii]
MTLSFEFITGGLNTYHVPSYKMDRPSGVPNYVLLLIKTPALFTLNGRKKRVEPNTVIIIEPGTSYSYFNPEGSYIDDWIHFDTKEVVLEQIGLPTNTFIRIIEQTNIHLLVQELLWEYNYTAHRIRSENISLLIQLILNNILVSYESKDFKKNYSPYNKKLRKFRIEIQANPEINYTSEEIAEKIGISNSYFQHLYKNLFGISFRKDFILMRIDYAKQLMILTDYPLSKIAEVCGYASEVHFYRQFKKVTGLTPSAYKNLEK